MVEQSDGSDRSIIRVPILPTAHFKTYAWIAQLVEHPLGKGKVVDPSSTPGSMIGYIYILKSLKNGRFYIGSTNDIERRLNEHNSGKSTYTSFSRPFKLIFSQEFDNLTIARKVEYKLKQFKSKKVIINIIESGKIKIDELYNISW